MTFLKDATDAELAARYAKADLKVRQMSEHGRLMDELDELMWQIREEMDRRRKENGLWRSAAVKREAARGRSVARSRTPNNFSSSSLSGARRGSVRPYRECSRRLAKVVAANSSARSADEAAGVWSRNEGVKVMSQYRFLV